MRLSFVFSLSLLFSPISPIRAQMQPTVAASLDHAKSRGAHGGKADGFRRRTDDDSTPPERLARRLFLLLVVALPWLLQHFRLLFQFVLKLLSDPASSGGEHRAGGRRGRDESRREKENSEERDCKDASMEIVPSFLLPPLSKKKKKRKKTKMGAPRKSLSRLSFLPQLPLDSLLSRPLARSRGHGGEKEAPDEIRVRLLGGLVALGK